MRETKPTVLVVDDEPDVRDVAEMVLTDHGFAVLTAPSGKAALGILEEDARRIDLLFSDVVMPGGMSGFALATKAKERRPDLRVILTSGYVAAEAAAAISQGYFPLLAKPYRPAQLLAAIDAAFATAPFNPPPAEDGNGSAE